MASAANMLFLRETFKPSGSSTFDSSSPTCLSIYMVGSRLGAGRMWGEEYETIVGSRGEAVLIEYGTNASCSSGGSNPSFLGGMLTAITAGMFNVRSLYILKPSDLFMLLLLWLRSSAGYLFLVKDWFTIVRTLVAVRDVLWVREVILLASSPPLVPLVRCDLAPETVDRAGLVLPATDAPKFCMLILLSLPPPSSGSFL
mmetsp:Transcript_7264/g.18052  ORF Transcript_7264/g.18052 Transcript_7264/m.18052 type:complete len:200 (-) Transcript_7264:185-784(-)